MLAVPLCSPCEPQNFKCVISQSTAAASTTTSTRKTIRPSRRSLRRSGGGRCTRHRRGSVCPAARSRHRAGCRLPSRARESPRAAAGVRSCATRGASSIIRSQLLHLVAQLRTRAARAPAASRSAACRRTSASGGPCELLAWLANQRNRTSAMKPKTINGNVSANPICSHCMKLLRAADAAHCPAPLPAMRLPSPLSPSRR